MRPKLSDKQKLAIYNQHCFGEKIEDLAESYEVSHATIYRCIREMRERHESGKDDEMAARSKVVAGDKANGRLLSTTDPHRFEGTCVVGGKKQSKAFVTVNAKKATEMWEKWCQDLRDEQEFMDRVERKEPEPLEEIRPIQVIEPAPVPEINVRPWREVAEERQQRIEELEAKVAELEASEPLRSDWVIERTEYENPILEHWFNNNGSFRVFWMNKPVYVLWAKSDAPKIYGVYRTMEAALAEVDRLNEVAAFLGSEGAFEVEEVAWKS